MVGIIRIVLLSTRGFILSIKHVNQRQRQPARRSKKQWVEPSDVQEAGGGGVDATPK